MTQLRRIRINGPKCSGGSLWALETDVLYGGAGNGQGRLVDKVAALRGLSLSSETQSVKNLLDQNEFQVQPPTLMQATLRFEKPSSAIIAAPYPKTYPERRFTHKKGDEANFNVLLGRNEGDNWPNVEFDEKEVKGKKERWPEITIPDMRCAAGAINVRLPAESGLAIFLHYNASKHTVFSGRPLKGNKQDGLFVTLVPEGIEIDLKMPHPLKDITAASKDMGDLLVRIRLEPDGSGFQARLIDVYTEDDLMADFATALYALKDADSPIRAETDSRIKLPPFSWQLHLDKTGLHVKPQNDSGVDWRIKIDPALIVVRLETDIGPSSAQKAIARLDVDQRAAESGLRPRLDLVRTGDSTTLRYALRDGETSVLPLQANYVKSGKKPFQFSHLETSEALKAYTPLDEAAARRKQPDGTDRHALLPVGAGTLQIRCNPEPVTNSRPTTPKRSALQGNCVFQANITTRPQPADGTKEPQPANGTEELPKNRFMVEVNDAAQAEAAVTWINATSTTISLGFGGVVGALRTALWTAEEAPTPDRLLPTGRLDPANLRELVPIFGPDLDNNSTLEFSKDTIDKALLATWTLSFTEDKKNSNKDNTAYLWTATAGLPLVTAAPMLAAGKGDRPSELRNLVPIRLSSPVTLKSGRRALMDVTINPIIDSNNQWPWVTFVDEDREDAVWGAASVQMVSSVAPGLDYALQPGELPDANSVLVSMRYDLPVLDELFAGVTAEESKQDDKTQVPVAPGTVAGVLDFDAMGRLWTERKFQLAATRTQDARATGWATHGSPISGPVKLAAPYNADAKVTFSSGYDLGEGGNVPLGGYTIKWENEKPKHFSGEAALLGPMGDKPDTPLPLTISPNGLSLTGAGGTSHLEIVGFAPDAYKTDIGLADTRGTSMQVGVSRDSSGVSRAAGFLEKPGASAVKTTLFTHTNALTIDSLGGDKPVHFWVRDLPLSAGVFDARKNPVEGSMGPDAKPFEAEALQKSLYEWRLFEDHGDSKRLSFTLRYGELELAPLRLLSYTPGADLLLLFRASLASPDASIRPAEAPYAVGPLLVMQLGPAEEIAGEPEKTEKRLVVKDVTTGRLEPPLNSDSSLLDSLYILDNSDRMSFALNAKLSLSCAGQTDSKTHRISVSLSAKPKKLADDSALTDVTLDFEIMGRALSLPVDEEAPEHFKYEAPDEKPTFSAWIDTAELKRDGADWRLAVTLGVHAALRNNGPVVLESKKSAIRWLGFDDVRPDELQVDIGRGSFWIERQAPDQNLPSAAEPIAGIPFNSVTSLNYSAALALDTSQPGNTAPVWEITAASILAEILGERKLGVVGSTELISLRSLIRCQKGNWTSRVSLDRDLTDVKSKAKVFGFQTSGISWDPDAVTVTNPDPKDLFTAATITIEKASPCQHDISVSLRDHAIPSDALEEHGESVFLSRSVRLPLQVRHQLTTAKGTATWRTVETAMLTSQALWKAELEDEEVFGPRYTNSNANYRKPTSPRPDAPGIGSRAAMLSGFDDAAFTDRLDDSDRQLILLGGTPGLLPSGDATYLFGLPWVISFDSTKKLPKELSNLMDFKETSRTWKAAQFDSKAFELPTGSLPPAASMPLDLLSGEAIHGFFRTISVSKDYAEAMARMTEQTYVEPEVEAQDLIADIARQDWPFFLNALVGLKKVLENGIKAWRVTSVATPTEWDLLPVALPAEEVETHVPKPPKRSEIQMMTVSAEGELRLFPLDLATEFSSLKTVSDQIGQIRQGELAMARDAGLQLAGLVEVDPRAASGTIVALRRARSIRLKDAFDEFGRAQDQLLDHGTQIYASAALGWPGAVAHANPARLAMVGTADAPVVSTTAGLAARSAALASGPAIAKEADSGRYLVTQSRSVFEHGDNYASATLPAPPARHLMLLPPRVRTPLPARRADALARLLGSSNTPPTMGLIPPAYGRGYIGARAGTLHSFADALLTDGAEAPATEANAPEFGRAAVLAPVIMRQLRTPRAPALPPNDDFETEYRRRTFVSEPDNREDKDKAVLIRNSAAAMWRGPDERSNTRFILDLKTVSIDPIKVMSVLESGGSYKLELGLWYKGDQPVMSELAQTGFLRPSKKADEATLRAWLSIGERRLNAERLSWEMPDENAMDTEFSLYLDFSNIDMTHLLEELRDPDPDTPAQLHFFFRSAGTAGKQFDKKGSARIAPIDADVLADGIPTAISLPIGRKPLGRPALDIRRRTYIFADPAFDRVLSSPGKSSQIVRMAQDRAAVLAIDRTEYDLSQTIYFAFGFLSDAGFEKEEGLKGKLNLKLKRKPEPGVDPVSLDLLVEGLKTDDPLDSNEPYALPLSRLQSVDGSASPRPGDQLQIEIVLNFDNGTTNVSVEVPLARQVKDPRPAAVYSVLGLSKDMKPRTLLHASAPAPDRIEFENLVTDLASGHIRKKAIFEWHETDLIDAPEWEWRTLVKTDRSGSAQMPRSGKDFDPPLQSKLKKP